MTNGEVGRFPLSVQVMSIGDMRHFYGELKDETESQKKFREYLSRDQSRASFAPASASDKVTLFLSFGSDER